MILRSPGEFSSQLQTGSARALIAKRKFEQHARLWTLAAAALRTVDADFADAFTGLAVTKGFRGSPHIDTTNTGPFYGLALGNFQDGTGGIQVAPAVLISFEALVNSLSLSLSLSICLSVYLSF
jgi:hypothetical protein